MDTKHHISSQISSLYQKLPQHMQDQARVQAYIKKTHEQFRQVVDSFILDHTNSVYLLKDENKLDTIEDISQDQKNFSALTRESFKKLIVYVDNSLCAAELNARRELIRLKYREIFGIKISDFEIRISRGSYKNIYPFKDQNTQEVSEEKITLTDEELREIEDMVRIFDSQKLADSYKQVLIANKLNNKFFSEKTSKEAE